MVENSSYMFLTGPKVVKSVTHEDVDTETLGGAAVHTTRAAWPTSAATSEEEAIDYASSGCSPSCPQNNLGQPPRPVPSDDPPDRQVPYLNQSSRTDPNKPYDMKEVISTVDDGDFLEIQPASPPTW
jgi:methylmalonyl-CoA decarboxylase subunit alpha